VGAVVLQLEEEAARDLYGLLYDYGENIAAGAPFSKISHSSMARLTAIFQDLQGQLGIESMADAMRRALEEKRKNGVQETAQSES
jgi:hypothetical protein